MTPPHPERVALLALADRCEVATGPNRAIDRDIGLALGLYDNPEDLGYFFDPAKAVVGGGGETFAPPAYTASLDAAITLVPCDTAWTMDSWLPGWSAGVWRPQSGYVVYASRGRQAATPALALCDAALRALAGQP